MNRVAPFFVASGLAIAAVALPVLGQDSGTKALAKLAQVKEPGPGAEPTASIDFKGGTLGDYIAAIEKAFGGSNTAVQPGLESLPVGPVKLVEVRRKEAVRAVEVLAKTPPGFSVAVSSGGDPEVFRVFADRRPEPPAPEKRVTVWTLSPVLDDKTSAEQVLSAVETALALVPGPAEVKYHKDTKLLIISGTDEHARAIHQVIGSLEQARKRASAQAGGPDAVRVQALEDENHELKQQVVEMELRLRAMNEQLSKPAR